MHPSEYRVAYEGRVRPHETNCRLRIAVDRRGILQLLLPVDDANNFEDTRSSLHGPDEYETKMRPAYDRQGDVDGKQYCLVYGGVVAEIFEKRPLECTLHPASPFYKRAITLINNPRAVDLCMSCLHTSTASKDQDKKSDRCPCSSYHILFSSISYHILNSQYRYRRKYHKCETDLSNVENIVPRWR